MRKRSTTRSGGASTWLAGDGGWTGARVGTRRSQDRRTSTKEEATAAGGRRKGNGVNPASGLLIYRGVHRICPLRFLLPYNTPQRLYSEKFAADFSLTDYSYDLNLSLGRQLNNKTTSGRPDGKHVLQAPTSHLFRSLTNHFVKTTKYMTEESEHYMDRSKIHKSPATSLDPEPDTQDKHTTRPGPPRAVTTTYFAEVEHVTRLLLAPGP
jgi:hypothetical protein